MPTTERSEAFTNREELSVRPLVRGVEREETVNRRCFRGLIVGLGLAALVLSGCSRNRDTAADPVRSAVPAGGLRSETLELRSFEDLADWRKADVIAVVKVLEERAVRAGDESLTEQERREVGETVLRDLVVEVEDAVRGRAARGDRIVMGGQAWVERDGNRTPWVRGDDGLWLNVGDRALVALVADKSNPNHFGVFTSTSVFILKDGQVVDTDRHAAVVKEHERLSETELESRARSRAS